MSLHTNDVQLFMLQSGSYWILSARNPAVCSSVPLWPISNHDSAVRMQADLQDGYGLLLGFHVAFVSFSSIAEAAKKLRSTDLNLGAI